MRSILRKSTRLHLSANDDKRVILKDGIHTLAYGHYQLKNWNDLSKYLTIKQTMEAKKQANRVYLTPEQVKANLTRAKHNWYLNNKDYYKPGGHGYEMPDSSINLLLQSRGLNIQT